jgi:hypothetical protein
LRTTLKIMLLPTARTVPAGQERRIVMARTDTIEVDGVKRRISVPAGAGCVAGRLKLVVAEG